MVPHFRGVGIFELVVVTDPKGVFMPYRYPPEFRRRVLDLLAVGRSVGVRCQRILGCLIRRSTTGGRQDRIDRGLEPGITSAEQPNCAPLAVGSSSWKPNWP